MIPTNLKVGDTFIENNIKFEVLTIVPLVGYTSRRIGFVNASDSPKSSAEVKPSIPAPKEEKPVTEDVDKAQLDSFNTYTKTEINRLNVTELEAVCDKLGLEKSTGVAMKKAIIDHLGL